MSLLKAIIIAISLVLVHRSSVVSAQYIVDTIDTIQESLDLALLYFYRDDGSNNVPDIAKNGKTRVKRQESEISKYVLTSKLPPIKILRIHLQMIRNYFTEPNKDIGGRHPMFHNVPKIIVDLFREHIYDYFFPEIGADAKPDRSRQI